MCNNYIYFSLKRIKFSFFIKTILNTIFIFDEDDDVLDNTVFFEFNDDTSIGIYINGANPIITNNRINEFDDFSLYSSYDELIEKKCSDVSELYIDRINVIFHSEYNELLGFYLFDTKANIYCYIIFLQDQLVFKQNKISEDLINPIQENLIQYHNSNFLIYEISLDNLDWKKINFL